MAKKPRKGKADPTPASSTEPSAANATSGTPPAATRTWSLLFDARVRRSFYLVLLAALYGPLSQQILAPVYGSIPSAIYHKYGMIASALLSFGIGNLVPRKTATYFGSWTFWIPIVHFLMFQYSSTLGNPAGPLIIECLTLYPLITLSMYLAAKQYEELDLSFLGDGIAEAAPSMLNYFLFTMFERLFRGFLPGWMGMSKLFTRVGLQIMIGATYVSVLPNSALWPAFPAVAFTVAANPHTPLSRTTDVLNNTLHLLDYSLIERHESLTGYVSVLQDNKNNFRVMRCDHSLLGGEWVLPPDDKRRVSEPVYAVFTMLEAVRLVEREQSKQPEKALTIGLGVGTAPSALIAHGIDTTVVELDPIVHHFAVKHFNLPRNHTAYIGDAVTWVDMYKDDWQGKYDYIIHDVFTGGAEPAALFTLEFLSGLKSLLKANGVVAINYAGDLALPSTSLVYRTIVEVFPSCRVFREDQQIGDSTTIQAGDFTNMVFICNKDTRSVQFRPATDADFLGSASRKAYMVPKHEVVPSTFERQGEILTVANVKILEKMHVQSALGHWKLMREVIPAPIWENW